MSSSRSLMHLRGRELGSKKVVEKGRSRCGICGKVLAMNRLQSLCVWGFIGCRDARNGDQIVRICMDCFYNDGCNAFFQLHDERRYQVFYSRSEPREQSDDFETLSSFAVSD